MCGIVGAVAQKDVTPILLEGLKRLEYRGYDSCGVAVHKDGKLQRARSTSRVAELQKQAVEREVKTVHAFSSAVELGPYQHYMQKEIFEQPRAIADTLEGVESIMPELFGDQAHGIFKQVDS
eukprot:gene22550-23741_t